MSFDKILKAGQVYFYSGYITQTIFTFIANLKYLTDRRRKLLYLGTNIDCRHEMEKFWSNSVSSVISSGNNNVEKIESLLYSLCHFVLTKVRLEIIKNNKLT